MTHKEMKHQLLSILNKGISIDLEGDKLQVRGNLTVLDDSDKQFFKNNKPQIIEIIKWHQAQEERSITKRDHAQPAMLSFSQQRLWLVDKVGGGSSEYNMSAAMQIKGPVDVNALNKALQKIVQRHEVLRTIYTEENGVPLQTVMALDTNPFVMQIEDLSDLTVHARQQKLAQILDFIENKTFDLTCDIMMRAAYIKLADSHAILVITMHHIASDGWSRDILTKELFALYQCYKEGKACSLPSLDIQYADYACWQRNYLQGELLESQLSYWDQCLQDLPPLHTLPLDGKRPEIKRDKGAKVIGSLSADLAKPLIALAKHFQLTPFMLLHAAFSLVMSKHSYNHDIVIGTAVANRRRPELGSLIGLFLNTLILRVNTEQSNLREYLEHVRTVHHDGQANQDVPFEQLVERQQMQRSTAYSPLFQIMLSTNDGNSDDKQNSPFLWGDLSIAPIESESVKVKFDLEVLLDLSDTGGQFIWIYDVALFSEQRISQFNKHLCNLLVEIAKFIHTPDVPLSSLSILSDKEIEYVVSDLNQEDEKVEVPLGIHQYFEQQVKVTPNNIALVVGDEHLTYAELNSRAEQVAIYLIENHFVAPNRLIGVCAGRSVAMVVGVLAILKSGCGYLPIDPEYSFERIEYMVDDAAIKVVLCEEGNADKLHSFGVDVVELASNGISKVAVNRDLSVTESLSDININTLAYVIYTSGTTGKPKGVMVDHAAAAAFITSKNFIEREKVSNVASLSPFVFDGFVFDLFFSLANGASVYLYEKNTILDYRELKQRLQRDNIDTLFVTTALFNQMVLNDSFSGSCVKQLLFGGERCDLNIIERFKENYSGTSLIHVYGTTETVVFASYCPLNTRKRSAPIGKRLSNKTFLILDTHGALAPFGAMGELYIGGTALAQGYMNQPELTNEKFVNSPFTKKIAGGVQLERFYRTGDLARYLPDGYLEFEGRCDDQIKIRGHRIKPGEIEACLIAIEEVDSSLIVVNAEENGLSAYIKPSKGISPLNKSEFIATLKHQLAEKLPLYMQPDAYVLIDEWPLTINGKINKKALPAPDANLNRGKIFAAKTDTEKLLVKIWSELLELPCEEICIQKSFFEKGGHSLLMTRMQLSIKTNFDVLIDFSALFKGNSIHQIALEIETKVRLKSVSTQSELERDDVEISI